MLTNKPELDWQRIGSAPPLSAIIIYLLLPCNHTHLHTHASESAVNSSTVKIHLPSKQKVSPSLAKAQCSMGLFSLS